MKLRITTRYGWWLLIGLLILGLSYCAQAKVLVDEQRIVSPKASEITFDLPEIKAGEQVRLGFDARLDWPNLGGHNPFMIVNVNGTDLMGKHLLNKPTEYMQNDGADVPWVYVNQWRLYYAPDFSDAAKLPTFVYAPKGVDPFRFVWDITSLVRPGKNSIRITSMKVLQQDTTVVVRNVFVESGTPLPSPDASLVKPAPSGPVETYVAKGKQKVYIDVRLSPRGAMRFGSGGRIFDVASRTSEPNAKWAVAGGGNWKQLKKGVPGKASWMGTGYRVDRVVRIMDDHIKVSDKFTNTGNEVVGVIYENALMLKDKPEKVMLAGRLSFTTPSANHPPGNPTVLAQWNDMAVGMAAEDDIFRVHINVFTRSDSVGLGDTYLGIGPGKSHTLEWSIYVVPKGDYWDFVNAVRRNWGSNFTIQGPVTFDHESHIPYDLVTRAPRTAADVGKWIEDRGAKWISSGQTTYSQDEINKYGGQYHNFLGEGTAIPLAKDWCSNIVDWIKKVHATSPGAKTMVYLDAQICSEPNAEKLYADCKVLDVNGNHLTTPYTYPIYLYLPTPENSYGKALMKTVQYICEEMGADGIYNDEFTYSAQMRVDKR